MPGFFDTSNWYETGKKVSNAGSWVGDLWNIGTSIGKGDSYHSKSAKFERDFLVNRLDYLVADAKSSGLHPLAALGISPYGAGGLSSGNPKAPTPRTGGVMTQEEKLNLQARTRLLNAQSAALEGQVNTSNKDGGDTPITDNDDIIYDNTHLDKSGSMGVTPGAGPTYSKSLSDDGYILYGLSDKAAQRYESAEAVGNAITIWPYIRNFKNVTGAQAGAIFKKALNPFHGRGKRYELDYDAKIELLRVRDQVTKNLKLKKGFEWRVNRKTGMVRAMPKKNLFFVDGYGNYNNHLNIIRR